MRPARQRFESDDPTGTQANLGLVNEGKLILAEGVLEISFQFVGAQQAFLELGVEDDRARPA